MTWGLEAERRRARYIRLCEAMRLCVMSGDRVAVITLEARVKSARQAMQYAEKMHRHTGFVRMPGVAQFAPADNGRDNRAMTGVIHGRG